MKYKPYKNLIESLYLDVKEIIKDNTKFKYNMVNQTNKFRMSLWGLKDPRIEKGFLELIEPYTVAVDLYSDVDKKIEIGSEEETKFYTTCALELLMFKGTIPFSSSLEQEEFIKLRSFLKDVKFRYYDLINNKKKTITQEELLSIYKAIGDTTAYSPTDVQHLDKDGLIYTEILKHESFDIVEVSIDDIIPYNKRIEVNIQNHKIKRYSKNRTSYDKVKAFTTPLLVRLRNDGKYIVIDGVNRAVVNYIDKKNTIKLYVGK